MRGAVYVFQCVCFAIPTNNTEASLTENDPVRMKDGVRIATGLWV